MPCLSQVCLPQSLAQVIRIQILEKDTIQAPPAISTIFALWAAGNWIHPRGGKDPKCGRLSSAMEHRQLRLNTGPWDRGMATFGQLYFSLPESCWKLFVRDVCYKHHGGHCRFSPLGCTFQGKHLTFTKPCVLLPLQHSGKARKGKALGMLMPGAPLARALKGKSQSSCCGPPEHQRAPAGFEGLLAHSELLVRSKEGLEEE